MSIDLDELEAKARAAQDALLAATKAPGYRADAPLSADDRPAAWVTLYKALNPAAVLELVQRLRAAEAIVSDLEACSDPSVAWSIWRRLREEKKP